MDQDTPRSEPSRLALNASRIAFGLVFMRHGAVAIASHLAFLHLAAIGGGAFRVDALLGRRRSART